MGSERLHGRSSGLSQRGNAKVPSPQTLPRLCQRVWGQPQHAHCSTRLVGSHTSSTHPGSTNCCCASLTVPGLPAPLQAQDQAPPEQVSWPWRARFNSTSPISFCGCCQPRSRLLSGFLGHHGAQQDPPSVVAPQARGWFSAPAWGEVAAHGARLRPARRNRLSHSW